MARTVSLTARVFDAAGHTANSTVTLTVNDTNPTALTARPNDGSSYWPDYSNTGHTRAPGYTGTITNYSTNMSQSGWLPISAANGTTFNFMRFLGKIGPGYNNGGDNFTFYGCIFEGTFPNDNLMQIYCPSKVTFKYCTFKPNQLTTPPGNNGTFTSSHSHPGTPYNKSWQYVANMVPGTVAVFENCDIWGNAGIQCTGGISPTNRAIFRNCYIHDQADTNGSGGSGYHHDGIGPDSEGGGHDTLIDHCTIASLGNTNGIALQGSSTYNRITIQNCYISGWGYALCIGATQPWQSTNIAVTDNIFSAELPSLFGPLYGNLWNSGNATNLWARNRYQVRTGDLNSLYSVTDHGKFWWPTDNNAHSVDYSN